MLEDAFSHIYLAFDIIKLPTVTWKPYSNHNRKYNHVLCQIRIRFRTTKVTVPGWIHKMFHRINGAITRPIATESWNSECCSTFSKQWTIIVSGKWTKFYDQCKLGSCTRVSFTFCQYPPTFRENCIFWAVWSILQIVVLYFPLLTLCTHQLWLIAGALLSVQLQALRSMKRGQSLRNCGNLIYVWNACYHRSLVLHQTKMYFKSKMNWIHKLIINVGAKSHISTNNINANVSTFRKMVQSTFNNACTQNKNSRNVFKQKFDENGTSINNINTNINKA